MNLKLNISKSPACTMASGQWHYSSHHLGGEKKSTVIARITCQAQCSSICLGILQPVANVMVMTTR